MEARAAKEVNVDCLVLEWVIPHAAQTINRFQIGEDDHTTQHRLHLKHFGGKTFDLGDQVAAKSKRKSRQVRQKTFDAKFREATWVGESGRGAEHIVISPEGGPAIKVRAAESRRSSERWNAKAVECVPHQMHPERA